MASKFLFSLGIAILTATAACAAPASDNGEENNAASADELRAAQSILVGTYSLKGDADDLPFYAITLNADHSFKATGGCRPSGPGAAHCHAITKIDGTWKNSNGQLELVDSFGQKTDAIYTLKSDVLSLKKTASSQATEFDKDLSHLPKLGNLAVCADKFDNTLGFCKDDFVCTFDGPDSQTQRCVPPI
jgi:hypothetical protein